MKVNKLKMESKLLGASVVHISDWISAQEVLDEERSIIQKYNPYYVYCNAESTDIQNIHLLEANGYRFSEFRILSFLNTSEVDVGTKSLYPYVAELLGDKEQLNLALEILKKAHDDDRFTNDPVIPVEFPSKRVINNLKKSFRSFPDEFILGLFNQQTDELIAFRSGVLLSNTEAHYYQYAIVPNRDYNHVAEMLESFTIDFLKQKGIKIIYAVTTGFNTDELNRLIKHHDFKIQSSQVILRKIFEPHQT